MRIINKVDPLRGGGWETLAKGVGLFLVLIILLLAISACTAAGRGIAAGVVKDAQAGADGTAQTLMATTCGMTVGAYKRLDNPMQKAGVDYMCPDRLNPPKVAP